MKNITTKILRIVLSLSFLSFLSLDAYAGSYLPWRLGYKSIKVDNKNVDIRIGYLIANENVPFKGNVLYYQGLGDSMLNHDPLFEVLTNAGYRVVAFDYMGQGGSAGSMDDTRISNINEIGDQVIRLLGRKNGPDGSKYHILGWSTGGLAAYRKAFYDTGASIKSIIMLAPGIAPNYFVGEGIWSWPILEISMRTLTNNKFIGVNDPHHDPIHPKSPLEVISFALNLQATAKAMRAVGFISSSIKGLTLLSGPGDTYVNAPKTKKVLRSKASHFKIKEYPMGLHELDNETEDIAIDVRDSILNFLNSQY